MFPHRQAGGAERERKNRHRRKSGILQQASQTIMQVLQETFQFAPSQARMNSQKQWESDSFSVREHFLKKRQRARIVGLSEPEHGLLAHRGILV